MEGETELLVKGYSFSYEKWVLPRVLYSIVPIFNNTVLYT